jgi:hypothetical protein
MKPSKRTSVKMKGLLNVLKFWLSAIALISAMILGIQFANIFLTIIGVLFVIYVSVAIYFEAYEKDNQDQPSK